MNRPQVSRFGELENGRPTRNQSVPMRVVTLTARAPSSPRAATSTARTNGAAPTSMGSITSTKAVFWPAGGRPPGDPAAIALLVAARSAEPGGDDAGLR